MSLLKKVILIISLCLFLIPSFVQGIRIIPATKCTTIEECINLVIDFLFLIAIIVAPLMILIAGFYFMTAAGNPERVRKAKDIMLYTVIGFVIVLLAKGIVSAIRGIITG